MSFYLSLIQLFIVLGSLNVLLGVWNFVFNLAERVNRSLSTKDRVLIYSGFALYVLVRWYYFKYLPNKRKSNGNVDE